MNEIEYAIGILENNLLSASVCVDVEYVKKHNQVISLAIEALKEKQERQKGCVWCKEDGKKSHTGKHFRFYCDYCGKELE
jgi:hypothetical protein